MEKRNSIEALTIDVKTVGSGHASVVDCAHGLMTLVAWKFHLIVLDNILLYDSVTVLSLKLRLLKSMLVKITLWNETIVARDVSCHLGGAHGQVVGFVSLLGGIIG